MIWGTREGGRASSVLWNIQTLGDVCICHSARFQPLEWTRYSEVLFEPHYSYVTRCPKCHFQDVPLTWVPGGETPGLWKCGPWWLCHCRWTADSGVVPACFITKLLWAAGHCSASHWSSLKGRFLVLNRFSEADVTVSQTGKFCSSAWGRLPWFCVESSPEALVEISPCPGACRRPWGQDGTDFPGSWVVRKLVTMAPFLLGESRNDLHALFLPRFGLGHH